MHSPARTPRVGLGGAAWSNTPSTGKPLSSSGPERSSPQQRANSGRFSDLPPRPPKVPMDSGTGSSVQQTQRRGSAPAAMQAAAQGMDPWMQGGAQFQRRESAPAAMQTTPQAIAHNLMWGAGSGRPQAPVGSQPPHAQTQSTYPQRPATAPPGAQGRIATSGYGKSDAGRGTQSTAAAPSQSPSLRGSVGSWFSKLFSRSSARISPDSTSGEGLVSAPKRPLRTAPAEWGTAVDAAPVVGPQLSRGQAAVERMEHNNPSSPTPHGNYESAKERDGRWGSH